MSRSGASVVDAVRVRPDHISLYILEVYAHLPLKQEIDRHGWTQQPDDVAAEMYESAMAMLDDAGYKQYEISNVCLPGHESRHNLKYWADGNWLGFGRARIPRGRACAGATSHRPRICSEARFR